MRGATTSCPEVVSVTAAESKNPERDFPWTARAVVLRLGLFCVLAILVAVLVVPWTVTAPGGKISASPFMKVFESAGISAATGIMASAVSTAALSSGNTNQVRQRRGNRIGRPRLQRAGPASGSRAPPR